MSDLSLSAAPPRPELLLRLRVCLTELKPPLRVLAQSVLGAESPIDFVTVDPDGRAVVALVGGEGECLELFGRGVAQRAWVEPRLRDWIKLAPDLPIRPELGARVLLLCPNFRAETLAAARALGEDAFGLFTYHCVRDGVGVHVLVEAVATGARPPPPTGRAAPHADPAPPPAGMSPPAFRTGLTDDDLGLTPAERQEFE